MRGRPKMANKWARPSPPPRSKHAQQMGAATRKPKAEDQLMNGLRKPKRWLRCPWVGGLLLGSDDDGLWPANGRGLGAQTPRPKGRASPGMIKRDDLPVDQVARKNRAADNLKKFWVYLAQTRRQNLPPRPCQRSAAAWAKPSTLLSWRTGGVVWDIIEDRSSPASKA